MIRQMLVAGMGLLMLASLPTRAEIISAPTDIVMTGPFMKFVMSPSFLRTLYDVGVAWDRDREASCPDGRHHVDVENVGEIYQQVEMKEGADRPERGGWSVTYRMVRCNRTIRYRFGFQMKPDRTMDVYRITVGQTQASQQLIRDMAPQMRLAASTAAGVANCQQFVLLDSYPPQVINPRAPGYQGQTGEHRRERWWVKVCGKPVYVDVDMFPNPKLAGISFSMKGDRTQTEPYVMR